MASWRDKAQRIIARLCERSYQQANTSRAGRRYRSHHAYTVPAEAVMLIDCLNTDDEERAKALFVQWAFRSDMPI